MYIHRPRKTVAKKVDKHKTELSKLRDYPISKKGATYWQRLACFVQESNKLFDIKGSPVRIKAQEQIWSVKMSPADHTFSENQFMVPQIGYCPSQVDRKWLKTQIRKVFDVALLDRSREKERVSIDSLILIHLKTSRYLNFLMLCMAYQPNQE